MKLVWNAIVKDEEKIIERCVRSILPCVSGGIVVDTGSSDNTITIIQRLFDEANKPIEISYTPFRNFEHARNTALDIARASSMEWDYLFLVDADMELKVERSDCFDYLTGDAYDLRQTGGSISYYNRRLINRKTTGRYIGVTHEFLDIASNGRVEGAYFVDHADGANRPDKFIRDIALLEEALKTELRQGIIERYTFYLAQSYFDAGDWRKAAEWYRRRVLQGGYDEERWNSQLHVAHCLDNLGDSAGFVEEMLKAYEMRPQRVETLYDLAKHFRLRGDNHTSLLFSEVGLGAPYAKHDLLFVNDYVYTTGLKEEFAICAYYDPARRERGAVACNELAVDPRGTWHSREQARSNLYWYLQPLSRYLKSIWPSKINIPVPDGYMPMNPSVASFRGDPIILVRTVNYTITPEGHYVIRGLDGDCNASNPIHTRNFLAEVDLAALSVTGARELALPSSWPDLPQYGLVRALEDTRIFEWRDGLYSISTVRELHVSGWCEQVLAPIVQSGYGEDWRLILPKHRQNEKNWVPFIKDDDSLLFMYRPGVLIDLAGNIVERHPSVYELDNVSGGSQVVRIAPDLYLAIVHEARYIPGRPNNRFYYHRFIRYDRDGVVVGVSRPFYFFDKQIEFAAGLAYFPRKNRNQLVVSFGVRDCEAWLATMELNEVMDFIKGS